MLTYADVCEYLRRGSSRAGWRVIIWRDARGQASERHLVPCCPGCVYIGRSLEMFFSPVIDITIYQRMRQYLYFVLINMQMLTHLC